MFNSDPLTNRLNTSRTAIVCKQTTRLSLLTGSCLFAFSLLLGQLALAEASEKTPVTNESNKALKLASAQYLETPQQRVVDGLIEAINQATVSAQTSGRVSHIYFDVNDFAQKGDILLRMRDNDQQASLKVAEANYQQANSEYKRIKSLFEKQLVAKSLLEKAEAELKSTRARRELAQEILEHTVVRAPYSGILVKRHIEVGETAQPGKALFTGLSLESLRVSTNISQDMVQSIRQYNSASIIALSDTDNTNQKIIKTETMSINPYADPQSHTFLVRVTLPTGDHGFYPGMAVKVAFKTGEQRRLVIPLEAVIHRSEVTATYVMDKNQTLSLRHIRTGQVIHDQWVEVLAGLEEGEQVSQQPVIAVSLLKDNKP